MPVAAVTPVLAAGFLPMFKAETAPATTAKAAQAWAQLVVNWAVAGGIVAAPSRRSQLEDAFERAFNPELAGGGRILFLTALQQFWMGMPVPAQSGTVTAFIPTITNIATNLPATATPPQQATALAQKISQLTLTAVKVTVPGPAVVPLL